MLHPKHELESGLIYFENGDFYKGQLLGGVRQGFGTFYQNSNNSTYIGNW